MLCTRRPIQWGLANPAKAPRRPLLPLLLRNYDQRRLQCRRVVSKATEREQSADEAGDDERSRSPPITATVSDSDGAATMQSGAASDVSDLSSGTVLGIDERATEATLPSASAELTWVSANEHHKVAPEHS